MMMMMMMMMLMMLMMIYSRNQNIKNNRPAFEDDDGEVEGEEFGAPPVTGVW